MTRELATPNIVSNRCPNAKAPGTNKGMTMTINLGHVVAGDGSDHLTGEPLRVYPASVVSDDDRAEYDDAFLDGETDCADGLGRNEYERGSPGWLGYEAGVKAFKPVRENREAQAHYSAMWYCA